MTLLTMNRIHNARTAALRAQNPKFKDYWNEVAENLALKHNWNEVAENLALKLKQVAN